MSFYSVEIELEISICELFKCPDPPSPFGMHDYSLFFSPSSRTVDPFRVFKKSSANGKITVYLGKRDFVDHISHVDPIGKKVFCLNRRSSRKKRLEDSTNCCSRQIRGIFEQFHSKLKRIPEKIYLSFLHPQTESCLSTRTTSRTGRSSGTFLPLSGTAAKIWTY